MARYINADELLNAIEEDCRTEYQGDPWYGRDKMYLVDEVIECINDAPTADVRPNVRGEWVEDELGTTVCSNCKNPRRDNRIKHIAFCNSCGADMRGEEHTMEEYMMGQDLGNPDDGSL